MILLLIPESPLSNMRSTFMQSTEELEPKASASSIHTSALELYDDYLELKSDIEQSFIDRNEIAFNLNIKYYNDYQNQMDYHINWLQCYIDCTTPNRFNFNDLLSDLHQWRLKMKNYAPIVMCYKNTLLRLHL